MNTYKIHKAAKHLLAGLFTCALLGGMGYISQNNVHADQAGVNGAYNGINDAINDPHLTRNQFDDAVNYWLNVASDERKSDSNSTNVPSDISRAHSVSDWRGDLHDDVTKSYGFNPKTDIDYSNQAPHWLRGYWKSNRPYRENGGNYYNYQELGVGANKWGFSSDENTGENNYVFNDVDGLIGIHKINSHKIYVYSHEQGYTGYWHKISKRTYNNESTSSSDDNVDTNDDDTTSESGRIHSHFKRTRSRHLLRRSRFSYKRDVNAMFNRYNPNDRRAYVPRWLKFRRGLTWESGINKYGESTGTLWEYKGHNSWKAED